MIVLRDVQLHRDLVSVEERPLDVFHLRPVGRPLPLLEAHRKRGPSPRRRPRCTSKLLATWRAGRGSGMRRPSSRPRMASPGESWRSVERGSRRLRIVLTRNASRKLRSIASTPATEARGLAGSLIVGASVPGLAACANPIIASSQCTPSLETVRRQIEVAIWSRLLLRRRRQIIPMDAGTDLKFERLGHTRGVGKVHLIASQSSQSS